MIVFAMTLGMLLLPAGATIAAAEVEHRVELAAQSAEHGHAHEAGTGDERHPGHAHGENSAEHSPDVTNTSPIVASAVLPFDASWQDRLTSFVDLQTCFRFERPPRPIAIS
jgi:hypothetical protein